MIKRLRNLKIIAKYQNNYKYFSQSIRPFRILGLQQIAVGSKDKKALESFWIDKLGISKIGSYKSEKENVDEDILTIGRGLSAVEIDIMTPINEEISPKVHIPALNHIGLWVDDLQAAHDSLSSQGVLFAGGIRKGASGHNVTFIHPKSAVGVLVELVQAPHEVITFYNN
mmetsp:Transcript_12204/g.11040  ORF Transcript_12204/g.11040 Transcript_12204/m.11040 type:complete len:170 (+) Transcript_12204:3-512(+)